MLSILIIEDELTNAARLKKMLAAIAQDIKIVGHLQTIRDSLIWLKEQEHPDVICMDIRLTDGLSFELFKEIEIKSHVIFTTAYDEYALKAFEVNGIDYLLKPLEASKLENSIKRIKKITEMGVSSGMLDILKKIQTKENVYRSRFLITFRDRYIPVVTTDVAYFSSENKTVYLTVHLGQRYMIEQTLEELEQELNPGDFFRISRQYIVAVKSIQHIYQSFNGKLKVELAPPVAESVLVSREKAISLKKWLNGSF